jgi:hypothetical protein
MVPLDPFRGTQEALRVEDEGILGCHNGKIVLVVVLDLFG